jgi:formamidopyrimidine-DNA glycosylase
LTGRSISTVARRGKFLLNTLSDGHTLAINAMLSGRLQLCLPTIRCLPHTQVVMQLSGGQELRYADRSKMGKLYLTEDLSQIPGWAEMGPDALDPQLGLEQFGERLRRHRGEIKGILTNARFVAGIGNAYADEICFHAGLYPFRKRPTLSPEEIARLYDAMRSTLTEAIDQVRQRMGSDIHEKPREFLAVHGKGGLPCPRCATSISQITARQRLTNFCRHCQPGSLIAR